MSEQNRRPWRADDDYVLDSLGSVIASALGEDTSPEEDNDHARLFAAAPEMLAALQAVRMSAGWSIMSDETRALVIEAIAKAEGR